MHELSPRLNLPLMVPGQGQKEITHNEALLLLDALVQPQVISMIAEVPIQPMPGMCWLVPMDADGEWSGYGDALAVWTEGGWRFVRLGEGARLWLSDEQRYARRQSEGWVREALPLPSGLRLSVPTGGGVVDIEARAAIEKLVAALGMDQKGTSSSSSSAEEETGEVERSEAD